MRFTKSALTTAILLASSGAMAVSGTVGTNVDGYDFSGHTARSQALQLDYFAGHQDSGDIFVNPALVGKYGSRVAINVDKGNNGANGDGGVFFSNGTSTYGVYIGRDSAANFGQNIATVDVGGNPIFLDQNPTSQFDLFYGFDTDAFAFGVRLNYQANEQKDNETDPITGIGTQNFASVDAYLDYLKKEDAALLANVNDPNYTGMAPLTQTLNTSQESTGWKYDASEINLSVGFALKELNIDGALLYGKASGSFKSNELYVEERIQLQPDGTTQTQFTDKTVRELDTNKYDLDKGETLALSLRGQLFETEDSKMTLSFAYVNQDYSTNYSGRFDDVTKDYEGSDVNNNDIQETDMSSGAESGKLNDKRAAYQLLGAYENQLDDATKLTVFSGLRYTELKHGISLADNGAEFEFVDHLDSSNNDSGIVPGTVGTNFSVNNGKDKLTSIPLVIAVEHSINDRWTGRASVSRDLYRNLKEDASDYDFNAQLNPTDSTEEYATHLKTNANKLSYQETWINQPTTAMVGVGYTRSNFTIDTVLGKEFFTAGTNNGVFGAASLGYKF